MFQNLFKPGLIGAVALKNRLMMPPISTNLACKDGTVSEEMLFHYAERARGGAGMITVENVCISYPLARHGMAQPRIDDDRFIAGLHRLSDVIHAGGAKAAVELAHPGINADLRFIEGKTPIGPSSIPRKDGVVPIALSGAEIVKMIDTFIEAARRSQEAGFDVVEVHACHGLLINQFLSPLTNKRQDEYGGSRDNRIRILVEIVKGIKRRLGDDFAVTVRLVAEDMLVGGLTLEDGRWFASRLEEVGVDAIHPDFGLGDKERRLEPMPYSQAWRVYLAEEIKKAVSIPVVAVGVIREPQIAEEILVTGKADFIALGRTLIADPDWPNKAQTGAERSIRHCIGCNECVVARHVEDVPLRCSVNATVGHTPEESHLEQATIVKRVLVIGGGPGGMEAARVAALRGHRVILFEGQSRLGGTLIAGSVPPGKEKLNWIPTYYAHELARLGVEVHLEEMLNAEQARALNPDRIIIATGSRPAFPPIPGVDRPHVWVAQELLANQTRVTGQAVVIIGGGSVGLETADYLATQGNHVAVLEMLEKVGQGSEPLYLAYLLRQLKEHAVEIVTGSKVQAIQREAVLVQEKNGEIRAIRADLVILAAGVKPANDLAQNLSDLHPLIIGDAAQPRKIINAVAEGFLAARTI